MATFNEPFTDIELEGSIENETLVNCIRNYRVTYDKLSKGYKIRLQKNAWKGISNSLGISVEEAQTRYKSIQTNFSKYVKRYKYIKQAVQEKSSVNRSHIGSR